MGRCDFSPITQQVGTRAGLKGLALHQPLGKDRPVSSFPNNQAQATGHPRHPPMSSSHFLTHPFSPPETPPNIQCSLQLLLQTTQLLVAYDASPQDTDKQCPPGEGTAMDPPQNPGTPDTWQHTHQVPSVVDSTRWGPSPCGLR